MSRVDLAIWVPLIPLIGAILCGICATRRSLGPLAGAVCTTAIFSSFGFVLAVYSGMYEVDWLPQDVILYEWMGIGEMAVNVGYYIDGLSMFMMLVVCGIGSLIAMYACGYMSHDRGIARFMAAVCLFIFSMTTVVMADNLVLLFLGWEMVGLCSYLLIGHYYQKPSAVAAAKKAFIVNRIGDFGFLLGIFAMIKVFGTVEYSAIFAAIESGDFDTDSWWLQAAPFFLMVGAFGKSAQFPLFVWLPDAMEGPTPVSALIHAATMVTSGVYMIARLIDVFQMSEYALPTVAVIGTATALGGALIATSQYDLKRVFAYSTVSQLGYMFMGIGVLATTGAVFHLMTHAFFKALLFLTAGNVMHALYGQLDMRQISGLGKKMPFTKWLMFAGCLALAGLPLTSGFFSKDNILAYTWEYGMKKEQVGYYLLTLVGLFTALLTAYYCFRVWFRVFTGPSEWVMGDEHHDDHADGHDEAHDDPYAAEPEHHEPTDPNKAHEMPFLPMLAPLVLLAVGAVLAGWLGVGAATGPSGESVKYGWVGSMVAHSSAAIDHYGDGAHKAAGHSGPNVHLIMMFVSGSIALLGVALAWYFHCYKRDAADVFGEKVKPLLVVLRGKFYVDEIYGAVFVTPLKIIAEILYVVDTLINGLIALITWGPSATGRSLRPLQRHGKLQGYAMSMAFGLGLVLVAVFVLTTR